eukprot:4762663-Lingulodinium_polyedra.AAC.1
MGYDPRANGRADRFVGIIKQRATPYLIHSGFPLKFLYWAVKQAARVYRLGKLNIKLPEGVPACGHRILVRDPKAEEKSFENKLKEALFLLGQHNGPGCVCIDREGWQDKHHCHI